jgi:hypothetical protein
LGSFLLQCLKKFVVLCIISFTGTAQNRGYSLTILFFASTLLVTKIDPFTNRVVNFIHIFSECIVFLIPLAGLANEMLPDSADLKRNVGTIALTLFWILVPGSVLFAALEAVATKELFGPVVRFWRRFQTGRERSIDKHLELLAPGVRVFHEVQRHGRVAEIVPDDEHGKLNSKPYRVLFDTGAMHAYSAASAAKLRVNEERILADVPDDANTDASQVPTGRPHAPPTMAQQEVAVEVAGVATSFDATRGVEPTLLAEWQAEALTDTNNESHTSCLAPQATETASGVSSEELLAVAAIADPSVGKRQGL